MNMYDFIFKFKSKIINQQKIIYYTTLLIATRSAVLSSKLLLINSRFSVLNYNSCAIVTKV